MPDATHPPCELCFGTDSVHTYTMVTPFGDRQEYDVCEGCLAVQLAHDAECFLADRLEADAATLDFEGLRNAAADCREASVLLRHQEKALREVLDTDYFTSPLVAWNRCVEVAREALEAREEEKK